MHGNKAGTIVRAVYQGTNKKEGDDKSYYIFAPGGSKQYLTVKDQDKWHYEDEEKVLAAVASHEAKMNNLKNASPTSSKAPTSTRACSTRSGAHGNPRQLA